MTENISGHNRLWKIYKCGDALSCELFRLENVRRFFASKGLPEGSDAAAGLKPMNKSYSTSNYFPKSLLLCLTIDVVMTQIEKKFS
jgi:hypothetical protein